MQGVHCRKKEGGRMTDILEFAIDEIARTKDMLMDEGFNETEAYKLIELSLYRQKNEALYKLAENIEGLEHIIGKVCNEGFIISGDIGMDDVANSILEASGKDV